MYLLNRPKPRRDSTASFHRTKSEGKQEEANIKSDKRDSDPTPMDEVDFWKRQASHYRTEAETWERIASNLKVRLIRLGEICKSFSSSWERLLFGEEAESTLDSPRDLDMMSYRADSFDEASLLARRRMSRPEPLVKAVSTTSGSSNGNATRTISSDAIPPFSKSLGII
jgi:hypothetical protein